MIVKMTKDENPKPSNRQVYKQTQTRPFFNCLIGSRFFCLVGRTVQFSGFPEMKETKKNTVAGCLIYLVPVWKK